MTDQATDEGSAAEVEEGLEIGLGDAFLHHNRHLTTPARTHKLRPKTEVSKEEIINFHEKVIIF